jgi:hypothetical protein
MMLSLGSIGGQARYYDTLSSGTPRREATTTKQRIEYNGRRGRAGAPAQVGRAKVRLSRSSRVASPDNITLTNSRLIILREPKNPGFPLQPIGWQLLVIPKSNLEPIVKVLERHTDRVKVR